MRKRFRKRTCILAALVGCVVLVGYRQMVSINDHYYRFVAANDRLFAIEMGSGYGTEVAVYVTDDVGDTWRRTDFPAKTLSIAGNGVELFALTSDGMVWCQSQDERPWTLVTSLDGDHQYSLLADKQGRFLVSGINRLTWHAEDGEVLREFEVDRINGVNVLFGDAQFISKDEQRVVVEANPDSVFVVELQEGTLSAWSDGLPEVPTNVGGIGHVRPFGSRFLLGRGDGVFQAASLGEPWRLLTSEFRITDALDTELCRDLIVYDPQDQQWLIATNAGIHLMEGKRILRTVFRDTTTNHATADDHGLIMQIVPFRGYFFVSFVRLKNNAMGVRLNHSLDDWQTMRNTAK
jgi:hypothetical protein